MKVCISGIAHMTLAEFNELPIYRRKKYLAMADKHLEDKNNILGYFISLLKALLGIK